MKGFQTRRAAATRHGVVGSRRRASDLRDRPTPSGDEAADVHLEVHVVVLEVVGVA